MIQVEVRMPHDGDMVLDLFASTLTDGMSSKFADDADDQDIFTASDLRIECVLDSPTRSPTDC